MLLLYIVKQSENTTTNNQNKSDNDNKRKPDKDDVSNKLILFCHDCTLQYVLLIVLISFAS